MRAQLSPRCVFNPPVAAKEKPESKE
jgi:hypothetical protein